MRLIDADALIQDIRENNRGYYFNSIAEQEVNFAKVDYAIDRISEAPTIEERPQGEWEYTQYDSNPNIGNWHCSECKHIVFGGYSQKPYYNFCPNCGANMRKEK